MEELQVTQLWMAGVVAMMVVFALLAGAGYILRKNRDK